jgi:4-alpha-glucanotransferase
MLACLAVEASRAGAGIIAEDLGTVGEGVREALDRWGVYGSALLLFERGSDGTSFLPPNRYRRRAFASIATHDLPTAAGFWTDASLKARRELRLLGSEERVQEAVEASERDRAALAEALVERGCMGSVEGSGDLHQRVRAMHKFIGRARSTLVAVSLNDALADEHQPNMPGTVDEYPNWSLPLASSEGRPLLLDDALNDPQLEANIQALRSGRERAERRLRTPLGSGKNLHP